MKLFYSEEATEDLARLRNFISVHNPMAARRISTKLIRGVEALCRNPKMGHPVAKAPDPEAIRDLIAGDYIVRYLLHKEAIFILRIWHHRESRDIGNNMS